jgi:hypothetical protein
VRGRYRQPKLGFVGGFYAFIGLIIGAATDNWLSVACFGFAAFYFLGVLIKGFLSLVRRSK